MAADALKTEWVTRVLGVEVGGGADPEAGEAASADQYRIYLAKVTKRMRSAGEASFGLVLGKSRDEHRMMLHPAKAPKSLASSLAGETGLRTMTWGTARPSPDRPGVMQLSLDGRQLPGLKKKAEQMLKAWKPLPFSKVELMVDGAGVDDLPDAEYADMEDRPASTLPQAPTALSPQGHSMANAARAGGGFCEECERTAQAQPEKEAALA